MVLLVVVASIDSKTVAGEADIVDMAVVATRTATAAPPAMMIVSVAHMGVAMTMDLVASTAMPRVVATTAIAAAAMTIVAGTTLTAVIVGARGAIAMLQETPANLMVEVETKTTALTIGTPVVDCGPLIYPGAERSAK